MLRRSGSPRGGDLGGGPAQSCRSPSPRAGFPGALRRVERALSPTFEVERAFSPARGPTRRAARARRTRSTAFSFIARAGRQRQRERWRAAGRESGSSYTVRRMRTTCSIRMQRVAPSCSGRSNRARLPDFSRRTLGTQGTRGPDAIAAQVDDACGRAQWVRAFQSTAADGSCKGPELVGGIAPARRATDQLPAAQLARVAEGGWCTTPARTGPTRSSVSWHDAVALCGPCGSHATSASTRRPSQACRARARTGS